MVNDIILNIMKRIIILTISIMAVFGIILFLNPTKKVEVKFEDLSLSQKIKQDKIQLIDVRTTEEYNESHADKAINLPLDNIINGDISLISKEKPVYLYCRTGRRATEAKKYLEELGYTNITNIGGLSNLKNENTKICSTDTPDC